MSHTTFRALLMATVLAAVMVGLPQKARAWTDCYGDVQDCQCYVRGHGYAYEAPYGGISDYVGIYPVAPTVAASRGNDTTFDECGGVFSWYPYALGQHWLAASACSQYPSSDFAGWIVNWYWEGSYVDNSFAPPGWYYGAGGSLPYYCCSQLGVCN